MIKKAIKRHTPADAERIRRHAHLACEAVAELARAGFDVISVRFEPRRPRIEVAHTPACRQVPASAIRYGVDGKGRRYERKAAAFCGCQVEWVEVAA